MIMEAGKSRDLPAAGSRTRRAVVATQSECKGLRIAVATVVSPRV